MIWLTISGIDRITSRIVRATLYAGMIAAIFIFTPVKLACCKDSHIYSIYCIIFAGGSFIFNISKNEHFFCV